MQLFRRGRTYLKEKHIPAKRSGKMEDQWQRLNNGELRRLLKRYRLLTLPPLVLGLLLTLLLTWLRVSSVP